MTSSCNAVTSVGESVGEEWVHWDKAIYIKHIFIGSWVIGLYVVEMTFLSSHINLPTLENMDKFLISILPFFTIRSES